MSERTVPNSSSQDVVSFDILVDGKTLDPGYQVISIDTHKRVNRIPTARVILRDGDASTETFSISESKDLIPGKEIQINLGRDQKHKTVFKGLILKHAIKIRENGESMLIIEARDKAVKMTIGRHSKYFEKKKDSDVIGELISEHGLSKEVEATKLTHDELVQYHSTDWDFMLSRAEVNGMLVFVDDGQVSVKAPDASGKETLTLHYGESVIALEAEMDARYQFKASKARSWDYKTQKEVSAKGTAPKLDTAGNINGAKLSDAIGLQEFELMHSGQVIKEELKAWADACLTKSRLAHIRGSAKIKVGFNQIKPGDLLKLEGVGARFNGLLFITAVRHEIGDGEWDTHIQFGLNPEWFSQEPDILTPPAAGLLPGIRGLQIGKVVKLEKDPDGEDRIQVKMPMVDPNAKGIWARVASLDAGKERGFFFRPELDDEVIVGFINDDPRDAVVLGMLHSSKLPAPLKASDQNHEKLIQTRSELRVHFHDETKTITIDTPAGNSILMDEEGKTIVIEDQNQNKIALEQGGITLDSPKDINLKAGGKINIEATADLSMKGTNISSKANAALKAEGATAKLAGSGITEIKGSLVKIN
ncbi:MAG: type VI secretion system tip protein VgrG [Bacteroidota bacterium]